MLSLRELWLAVFIALAVSVALTLVAHLWICAGFHPETLFVVDWLAPLCGVFYGAFFLARRSPENSPPGWRSGLRVALPMIAMWFLAWSYLVARFDFSLWPRQVFGGLNLSHLLSWSFATLFAVAGAMAGEGSRRKKRGSNFTLTFCILAILPLAMQCFHALHRAEQPEAESETVLAGGVTLRTFPPTQDGTTVRLLKFDLARRRDLTFGIYDADSDDAEPFDDRNTTWLGQPLERVLASVQNREGKQRDVLCLVNGGFFGAKNQWTAFHEAPLVVDGKPFYPTRVLARAWPEQAGMLTVERRNNRLRFSFQREVAWEKTRSYETVLGGVRGLLVGGKAQSLKPGMGGTTLRCSRTSVGWSNDSRFFYILSVRDPDGEKASMKQRAVEKLGGGTQSGGWDVRQVQQFWQKMRVPNAVLFDGGESTQLALRKSDGETMIMSSAYQLKRTFGYWRSRPLRAYFPLLPPAPNHGGVLNYFYIAAPHKTQ